MTVLVLDMAGVLFDPSVFDDSEPTASLYDDVLPFLKGHKADKLVLCSSGVEEVERPRLAALGIEQFFDECIFTEGSPKGEVLAKHPEACGSGSVFVDDDPRALEGVAAACPEVTPVLMERSTAEERYTVSEFMSVENLTELEAFLDAKDEWE